MDEDQEDAPAVVDEDQQDAMPMLPTVVQPAAVVVANQESAFSSIPSPTKEQVEAVAGYAPKTKAPIWSLQVAFEQVAVNDNTLEEPITAATTTASNEEPAPIRWPTASSEIPSTLQNEQPEVNDDQVRLRAAAAVSAADNNNEPQEVPRDPAPKVVARRKRQRPQQPTRRSARIADMKKRQQTTLRSAAKKKPQQPTRRSERIAAMAAKSGKKK
jgi:hypothetical protein